MPRLPRIYVDGALYYISCQVMPHQKLFDDQEDYQKYLQLVTKEKEQCDFKLFSFLLLPTQIILLLELKPETSISEIMHNINSTYTKYFNSRYGKRGHLFKGRYNALLIEKTFLLPLTRYIHLSSCSGKACFAPDELHSSYPLFVNVAVQFIAQKQTNVAVRFIAQMPMEEEIKEVLNYLPDKDYANYIRIATPDELNNFGKRLYRRQVVGSPEFEERVKSAIETRQHPHLLSSPLDGEEGKERGRHLPVRFAFATTFAILFLLSGALYFYSNNNRGQNQLEVTQSQLELSQKRLELAKNEYYQKLSLLEEKAKKEAGERKISALAKQPIKPKPAQPPHLLSSPPKGEEGKERVSKGRIESEGEGNSLVARPSVWQEEKTKLFFSLEGSAWEIELKPASGEGIKKDRLIFNDGKFNSSSLSEEGFPYSNYSLTYKDDGAVIWETMQTNPKAETANWYGEWKGNRMRGILYQKKAGEEKNFSFIATKRQSIS